MTRFYWDPADNLSGIRYSAFGHSNDRHREAFLSGYGCNAPDEKRTKYYNLLTRIDGAPGSNMKPHSEQNDNWKRVVLAGFEELVSEMEAL